MVEKLAFDGGKCAVPEWLPRPWPWITDEEREAILSIVSRPDGSLPRWYSEEDPRLLLEKSGQNMSAQIIVFRPAVAHLLCTWL